MNFNFDQLYYFIFEPKKAIHEIKHGKTPFSLIFIIPIVFFSGIIGNMIVEPISQYQNKPFLMIWSAAYFFIYIILWIINSCIVHFTAETTGGKGKITDIFFMFGMSDIPYLFSIPLCFIILHSDSMVQLQFFIAMLCLLLWSVYLKITCIKINYNIPLLSSIFTFLTPFFIFLLFFFSFLVFFISIITSQLQ